MTFVLTGYELHHDSHQVAFLPGDVSVLSHLRDPVDRFISGEGGREGCGISLSVDRLMMFGVPNIPTHVLMKV